MILPLARIDFIALIYVDKTVIMITGLGPPRPANDVDVITEYLGIATETDWAHTRPHSVDMFACQGFMQDKIIVSHTCFDGHVDVNC